MSICDKCHTEQQMKFDKQPKSRRDRFLLPDGWVHVQGNSRNTTVFEMDLCKDCARIVKELAGAFTA
jgi:hypothetical protein